MLLTVTRRVEVLIELLQALVETVTYWMIMPIEFLFLTGMALTHVLHPALLGVEWHLAVTGKELLPWSTLILVSGVTKQALPRCLLSWHNHRGVVGWRFNGGQVHIVLILVVACSSTFWDRTSTSLIDNLALVHAILNWVETWRFFLDIIWVVHVILRRGIKLGPDIHHTLRRILSRRVEQVLFICRKILAFKAVYCWRHSRSWR